MDDDDAHLSTVLAERVFVRFSTTMRDGEAYWQFESFKGTPPVPSLRCLCLGVIYEYALSTAALERFLSDIKEAVKHSAGPELMNRLDNAAKAFETRMAAFPGREKNPQKGIRLLCNGNTAHLLSHSSSCDYVSKLYGLPHMNLARYALMACAGHALCELLVPLGRCQLELCSSPYRTHLTPWPLVSYHNNLLITDSPHPNPPRHTSMPIMKCCIQCMLCPNCKARSVAYNRRYCIDCTKKYLAPPCASTRSASKRKRS